MLPRENTSLLDAQTTQDHPQTPPYTRVLISQSPRFFLLITISDSQFACKHVAEATSARPSRAANGPDGRRPRATCLARDPRASARRDAATSTITRLPRARNLRSNSTRGWSRIGLEGGWAPNSRADGGCAPSEWPQRGRPDPSRCRLGKPTPREAGDARKPPPAASRRGSRRLLRAAPYGQVTVTYARPQQSGRERRDRAGGRRVG